MSVYFINYLINSGGMFGCILYTLAHIKMSVSSVFDDDKLLEVIEKVQVSEWNRAASADFPPVDMILSISISAVYDQHFPVSTGLDLPPPESGEIRPVQRCHRLNYGIWHLPGLRAGDI